ncbi:cell wall-binding repeat-containing protein [Peptostreptococcaceae bacterium OttesenSCG-928-C18]|nr:cell wall-binding repeat-containing protein [Peptostreptococcaceae bacterium OttesenSCG-928-C18]
MKNKCLLSIKKIVLGFVFAICFILSTYITSEASTYLVDYYDIAGRNRYETSYSIAKTTYPEGTTNAVIVNGNNFPDALSATALAKKYDAPILLVDDYRENDIKNILGELKIKNVYIVGGEGSVSSKIYGAINNMNEIELVNRIEGLNRYQTNLAVIDEIFESSSKAIIATGANFPDALAISPYAYKENIPLYLSGKIVTQDTINHMKNKGVEKIIVVGDSGSIDSTLLKSSFGTSNVEVIQGADRYKTSQTIFNKFYNAETENIVWAKGDDFPDALSAISLAGKKNTTIMLYRANFIDTKNSIDYQTTNRQHEDSADIKNQYITSIYNIWWDRL